MRLGYLAHNLNDAAVERRCRMLNAGGADITLAGFCRDPEMNPAPKARSALMLGQSHDAALLARAAMTVKNSLSNRALLHHFAGCDAIIARNLEQMMIAMRVSEGRPLIYECLDIHRSLLEDSLTGRVIQKVEAALLRRSDLLITSSPAFIRNHFEKREFNGETMLVENKLLLDPIGAPIEKLERRKVGQTITIGWFGMLRCKRTLDFLTELVLSSDGKIEVLIAGKPSDAELPHLEAQVAAQDGMSFAGPYSYDDLPELYGRCDFAWSIDWFEEGMNSKWLLPNRLYEAIAYGTIPIALADVEVGRWLSRARAGMVLADADEASTRLQEISPEQLADMQSDIDQIERSAIICSQAECDQLVCTIEKRLPR